MKIQIHEVHGLSHHEHKHAPLTRVEPTEQLVQAVKSSEEQVAQLEWHMR